MPTVCELKIEAKNRGLKGYSTMKKAELENLLGGAGSSEKKETPPKKVKKLK